MSKSKIPVRDLTPMFYQVPTKDSHRSRREKQSTFSDNFVASDRSKSHERDQRSNDKVKDLRNLVSQSNFFPEVIYFHSHRFSQSF